MKIKIRGNVGDNSPVTIGCPCSEAGLLEEIRRIVREELRSELYSEEFAEFLRNAVDGGTDPAFRERAEELLNQAVRVETAAGPVSGTLIEVGEDYLIIQETPTTQIIVPFQNAVSISPL